MLRIIFLDVDGVLNNRKSMQLAQAPIEGELPIHPPGPLGFLFTVDPEAVTRFREVVEELDLKIVLSSTWRFHPTAIQTAFKWCGWENPPFIGSTPRNVPDGVKDNRGNQIQAWIDQNLQNKPHQFVIVDDDSDIHQNTRFVQTDHELGLTEENCNHIRMLFK